MIYLLDTNAVIAILKGDPPRVRKRFRHAAGRGGDMMTSSVALYELWYGVARSQRQRENAERLRVFLTGRIRILPFSEEDAAVAGELRASLESKGTPIGPYDLMIAAQALRAQATLVSANVAEFKRVRGLAVQDWSANSRRTES